MPRRSGLETRLGHLSLRVWRTEHPRAAGKAWRLRDRQKLDQKTSPPSIWDEYVPPALSPRSSLSHLGTPPVTSLSGCAWTDPRPGQTRTRLELHRTAQQSNRDATPGMANMSRKGPCTGLAECTRGRQSSIISGQGESPTAQNSHPSQLPQGLKLYQWRVSYFFFAYLIFMGGWSGEGETHEMPSH